MGLEISSQATGIIIGLAAVAVVYFIFKKKKSTPVLKGKDELVEFVLTKKETLTHDTTRYTFGFPNDSDELGLYIGGHVSFHAKIDGEDVMRMYTPVSDNELKGSVQFVIKTYRETQVPVRGSETGEMMTLPKGKMGSYLESLPIDSKLSVSGPTGQFSYLGNGEFRLRKTGPSRNAKKIGMISGGTGITPMYQIANAIMADKTDKTQVSLLFANKSVDDILIKDLLDQLQAANPDRFKVHFTVDKVQPGEKWDGSEGFISADMIKNHVCAAPSDDTMIIACGPPPMYKFAIQPNLVKLGFPEFKNSDKQYYHQF